MECLKEISKVVPSSFHTFFFHLGGSSHNSSSPSHLLQVLQGNTEAFPSQLRDAVSGGTCHEEDSQDSQVLWNFHLCLFSAYSLEDEHRTKLWLSSQTDNQFTRFPSQIQTWRKGQKSCCWCLFLFSFSFFFFFSARVVEWNWKRRMLLAFLWWLSHTSSLDKWKTNVSN